MGVDPGDQPVADRELLAADLDRRGRPARGRAASRSRARALSSATSRVRRAIITASAPRRVVAGASRGRVRRGTRAGCRRSAGARACAAGRAHPSPRPAWASSTMRRSPGSRWRRISVSAGRLEGLGQVAVEAARPDRPDLPRVPDRYQLSPASSASSASAARCGVEAVLASSRTITVPGLERRQAAGLPLLGSDQERRYRGSRGCLRRSARPRRCGRWRRRSPDGRPPPRPPARRRARSSCRCRAGGDGDDPLAAPRRAGDHRSLVLAEVAVALEDGGRVAWSTIAAPASGLRRAVSMKPLLEGPEPWGRVEGRRRAGRRRSGSRSRSPVRSSRSDGLAERRRSRRPREAGWRGRRAGRGGRSESDAAPVRRAPHRRRRRRSGSARAAST